MCRGISEGGRRCRKHAAEVQVKFSEYEQMSDEEKLEIDEPLRMAQERRMTLQRAAKNEAARKKRAEAREVGELSEEEVAQAIQRGKTKAKRSINPNALQQVAVRVSKTSIPAENGAGFVRDAITAAPYLSDDSDEEVQRKSNNDKARADETIAAERATIRNPAERAGRHRANPYDNSEELKVVPSLTREQKLAAEIEAGVFGHTMNAYAARMVYNHKVKGTGLEKDMRAVNTSSSNAVIDGRKGWLNTPLNERLRLMTGYHQADAALERQKELGQQLSKSDERIAALKLRQQTLAEWQKAPHPDGGYGTELITKKELELEKHEIAAELGKLREEQPAIRKEYKSLAAAQDATFIKRVSIGDAIYDAVVTGINVGTNIYRGNHAHAFMTSLNIVYSMRSNKAETKHKEKQLASA